MSVSGLDAVSAVMSVADDCFFSVIDGRMRVSRAFFIGLDPIHMMSRGNVTASDGIGLGEILLCVPTDWRDTVATLLMQVEEAGV